MSKWQQNQPVSKMDRIEGKIDDLAVRFAIIEDLKKDIKKNSEFRQQAKGIIGFITFVFIVLGGFIIWIWSKIKGL